MSFSVIGILLLSTLIIILLFFFFILLFQDILKGSVPFVPARKGIENEIVQALQLSNTSRIVDLGSGDGRILFAVLTKYPGVTAQGYEWKWLPLIISKTKQIFSPHKVNFSRQDFFTVDVSGYTHVFTYLFPRIMDELLPKLLKELPKGARLVSCDFEFTHKKPIEIIELVRDKKNPLGKKLFVYEF